MTHSSSELLFFFILGLIVGLIAGFLITDEFVLHASRSQIRNQYVGVR